MRRLVVGLNADGRPDGLERAVGVLSPYSLPDGTLRHAERGQMISRKMESPSRIMLLFLCLLVSAGLGGAELDVTFAWPTEAELATYARKATFHEQDMLAWWLRILVQSDWVSPAAIESGRRLAKWREQDWLYTELTACRHTVKVIKRKGILRLRVDCAVEDIVASQTGKISPEQIAHLRKTLREKMPEYVLRPSFGTLSLFESVRIELKQLPRISRLEVTARIKREPRDLMEAINILRSGQAADLDTKGAAGPLLQALTAYAVELGAYPPKGLGLKALFQDPGVKGWMGPYANKRDLRDRWGKPFIYQFDPTRPRILSVGPDGQRGTEDDIVHLLKPVSELPKPRRRRHGRAARRSR